MTSICGWPDIGQSGRLDNSIDRPELLQVDKMEGASEGHTHYCEAIDWPLSKLWDVESDVTLAMGVYGFYFDMFCMSVPENMTRWPT